jgi:hypothetical protein
MLLKNAQRAVIGPRPQDTKMIKPTTARTDRARLLSTLLATTAIGAMASPALAEEFQGPVTSLGDIDVYGRRIDGYRAGSTTTVIA